MLSFFKLDLFEISLSLVDPITSYTLFKSDLAKNDPSYSVVPTIKPFSLFQITQL